jgi:hypothetical protein
MMLAKWKDRRPRPKPQLPGLGLAGQHLERLVAMRFQQGNKKTRAGGLRRRPSGKVTDGQIRNNNTAWFL